MQVQDLFHVRRGVVLHFNQMEPDPSGIPYVSRKGTENGIVCRVRPVGDAKPNPAWTISVPCGGSVLECFLQKEPYYSGSGLLYLKPRKKMSEQVLLFYCMALRANRYRYNYGREATHSLPSLVLPAMREIPSWVPGATIPPLPSSKAAKSNEFTLSTEGWKWFQFEAIFTLKKGERLTIEDMEEGTTPFIGAGDSNNGYRDFISEAPIFPGNTVTVNYNGSVGEAFYQPEPYWASDDCHVLSHPRMNKFVGMFIVTIIKMERYRFRYGRKWNMARMKKSEIKLPVDENGKPDWDFMESYIKSLPYSSSL